MALISVVAPCFNEEDNVDELYRRVTSVLGGLERHTMEFIFIDNASTDATSDRLRALALRDPRVRIIFNARNFGHIRSPMHAILQARGTQLSPWRPTSRIRRNS